MSLSTLPLQVYSRTPAPQHGIFRASTIVIILVMMVRFDDALGT